MKQAWQSVLLALCFSVGLSACNASEVAVQTVHTQNGVAIDVIKVEKLADLRLYLNNSRDTLTSRLRGAWRIACC